MCSYWHEMCVSVVLNLTHMRLTCACLRRELLVVANYTCQQCFSLQLAKEVKVTPPGTHVTPTEPDLVSLETFSVVYNVASCHWAFLPQPCRHTGLSWGSADDTGSIQVIFQTGSRTQKLSQPDFNVWPRVFEGVEVLKDKFSWRGNRIWHTLIQKCNCKMSVSVFKPLFYYHVIYRFTPFLTSGLLQHWCVQKISSPEVILLVHCALWKKRNSCGLEITDVQ